VTFADTIEWMTKVRMGQQEVRFLSWW